MQEIYDLLIEEIDKTRVSLDEPMSKHTSFKIGGPADVFVKVDNISELEYLLEIIRKKDIQLTIIRKSEPIY